MDLTAIPRPRPALALLAALAVGLVAACSTETDSPPPSSGTAATTTITHAFGETDVGSTDRVAVLDGDRTLEAVVALGIDPVAAVVPPLTGDYAPVVREELDGEPADIGTSDGGINLEALAAAEPDLIVMQSEGAEELYEQVSQIAPTVAVEYTPSSWKDTLTQIGGFLGREDAAADLVTAYDERAAEAAATAPQDTGTLSIVRVRTDGFRYMTQEGSFPWSVALDLGRQAPAVQDLGEDGTQAVDVSMERLDLLVADDIVILVDDGAEAAAQQVEDLLHVMAPDATYSQIPSKNVLFGNVLTAQAMLDTLTTD
ncbi:ABC transporter substrate-binding protein [Sanguibacter sp. 4.1]|uniref:ABC transporter substrate-binding protein n=1 Tax=Sanguibacter biliveldensis TaxID=3030830 RepID=A0AAF1C543_9MICO|nr:ABC transporter substrate-binding protein [Sanguibacter sp. 4.1]WPF83718.1 ABC transporter substrate-binding protein [Sanguibacter sp. 4.1]